MDKKQWALKIEVILAGSILSAYGITLAMYAGFGSATLAVLWQGILAVRRWPCCGRASRRSPA